MSGMNGSLNGTNGTADCTAVPRLVVVGVVAVSLIVAAVNALTTQDDFGRAGIRIAGWEPWAWELTSAAFWIALTLPLLWSLRRLRPPRFGWPVAAALFVLLVIMVSVVHVGWMGISRRAIYAVAGTAYDFDWTRGRFLYEGRKDLLTMTIFAAISVIIDRWPVAVSEPLPPPPALTPFRIEVRDGTRTRWFAPEDIERVEAAGNYVELSTPTGPVLHRTTLAAIEADLSREGFVRIHRSRLVRRTAVTATRTTPSGDFEAVLASGVTVAGSRRFRGEL